MKLGRNFIKLYCTKSRSLNCSLQLHKIVQLITFSSGADSGGQLEWSST